MTNNIFVPQTFNGERMVNVNLPNRRVGGATPPTPITDNNRNNNNTSASTTATHQRIAPAPSLSVEAFTAGTASPNHLKANASPPSSQQFVTSPVTAAITPSRKNEDYVLQKYWSEANIAILIQLHRKYFGGISSEDTKQNVETWIHLTKEYNTITSDKRSKSALVRRWGKLMRKYNAERSCLLMHQQKPSSSTTTGQQQQMPMVSYWNHFQYMDGYLNHLPIPEDSLYLKKRITRSDEDSDDYDEVIVDNKRRSTYYDNDEYRKRFYTDDKLQLLETQRLIMEQTLDRQQSQIDMMKKNYDSMNRMNMKFIDICEKVTSRNQSNESRYLDLLEKYIDDKLLEKNKTVNTTTTVEEEAEATTED